MSPEQIQGLAVDARSDVYACGMVLYQLVTGALPFSAKSDFEWQEAHVRRPPAMGKLRVKAPELVPVVERAIAKEPGGRFGSAAEMGAGLVAQVVTVPAAAAAVEVRAAAAPVSVWRTAAEPREVEVDDGPVPMVRLNRNQVARVALAIIVLVLIGLGGRLLYKRWEARHFGVRPQATSRNFGVSAKVASISRVPASKLAAPSGMVFIPPGTFQIGSPAGEGNEDEKLHTVTVSGFWLDETAVTVQAYQGCVKAGKCAGTDTVWWLGPLNPAWSEHRTFGNSPPRSSIRPGLLDVVEFRRARTV
jgi:formylglycine-generating enzyme required for sulfatase activity